MRRGEIYRVQDPGDDPKAYRSFVVVSRQPLIDSNFSTVICAPIFTQGQGLVTQIAIGPDEGMKYSNWVVCDNLVSVRKAVLTRFVGSLSKSKMIALDFALTAALGLD